MYISGVPWLRDDSDVNAGPLRAVSSPHLPVHQHQHLLWWQLPVLLPEAICAKKGAQNHQLELRAIVQTHLTKYFWPRTTDMFPLRILWDSVALCVQVEMDKLNRNILQRRPFIERKSEYYSEHYVEHCEQQNIRLAQQKLDGVHLFISEQDNCVCFYFSLLIIEITKYK